MIVVSLLLLMSCDESSTGSEQVQEDSETSYDNLHVSREEGTKHRSISFEKNIRLSEIIAQQREMTALKWQELKDQGYEDDAQLRVEFYFNAASEEAAEVLERFLTGSTDYEVTVVSHGTWIVKGAIPTMKMSAKVLDQWVAYMVRTGLEYDCKFDGWDATLP